MTCYLGFWSPRLRGRRTRFLMAEVLLFVS